MSIMEDYLMEERGNTTKTYWNNKNKNYGNGSRCIANRLRKQRKEIDSIRMITLWYHKRYQPKGVE